MTAANPQRGYWEQAVQTIPTNEANIAVANPMVSTSEQKNFFSSQFVQ